MRRGILVSVWVLLGSGALFGQERERARRFCVDPSAFTEVKHQANDGSPWRVYFRRASTSDPWYYVEMERPESASKDGMLQAILPKTLTTTARIHYKIVRWAADGGLREAGFWEQFEEADVMVGGCPSLESTDSSPLNRLDPLRPVESIVIVVHRGDPPTGVPPNAVPLFPPGFEEARLKTPEDSNRLLIAGLVAGGAAVATVGVLAPGDTLVVGDGADSSEPPVACAAATPEVVAIGEMVSFNAMCSTPMGGITRYRWDFGDGTSREGPEQSVDHAYAAAGRYNARLTTTNSAGRSSTAVGVEVQAMPVACIEVGPALVVSDGTAFRFDGSCSRSDSTKGARGDLRYSWDFGDGTTRTESVGEEDRRRVVQRVFPKQGRYGVTLTVTNEYDLQAEDYILVVVDPASRSKTTESEARRPVSIDLGSHLDIPPSDGSVRGHILLNEQSAGTADSAAPRRYQLSARTGKNTIDAVVSSPAAGEGRWRFDLSRQRGLVPGSLRVEHGQVISLDGSAIVFRLSGSPGERIKFRFELAPSD